MLLVACTALAYVLPQSPALRTPLPQSPARAGAPAVMQAKPEAVRLSLAKPLGLVLEERPGGAGGVYVESLVDGGSALASGAVQPGDVVVSVAGTVVASLDFDSVMEAIGAAPDEVALTLARLPAAGAPAAPAAPAPAAAEWAKVTVPGVGASDVRTGTILRTALLDNKVEVYTFKGKMMNCGGVGQCNYCTVRIADGMDSLSERTPGEEKFLKKKPADYRLACQAFVNGDATVEALPGQ